MKTIGAAVVGAAAIGLSVGIAAPAEAATITGSISGTVILAGTNVPNVDVGDPVTGFYIYDDSVVVSDFFFGNVNPFTDFSLSIGTNPLAFTFADLATFATSGRNIDLSIPTQDVLGFFFAPSALEQFVGSPSTLGSQAPTLPPAPFAQQYVAFFTDPTRSFGFSFQATPTPIPTPALLPGLLGMGIAAWKKRKNEQAEQVAETAEV